MGSPLGSWGSPTGFLVFCRLWLSWIFFLDVVEFLFSKGEEEEEETEVFCRLWLSWIFFFLEGEEEEGD